MDEINWANDFYSGVFGTILYILKCISWPQADSVLMRNVCALVLNFQFRICRIILLTQLIDIFIQVTTLNS